MPSRDPQIRHLVGQIAIFSRLAGAPPKAPRPHECIPPELRDQYLREVDPQGSLPASQRQKKAAAAYKRDIASQQLRAYRDSRGRGDDAA